ncbi:glycosyltransferase family 2 protein [Candidatus Peregrinibacteria bacterium CG_4_10_14_0_2_um_filter_43_11]|nr:MAG: glycosyltransferase family 2 protein [Candidatus Peregrinibacteria bacterium CG_4_10_14_0_2_um_filter_43_11]
MDKGKKLVIYMPAFNEEVRIGATLDSLPHQLDGIDGIEVLVIDDGSTDNTKSVAEKYGATVYSHATNKGVGAAFHTGVNQSLERGADIVVSIDADGQFNPKDIPNLIRPILKGEADFVTGNRFHQEGVRPKFMSRVKYWGNRQIARLVSSIARRSVRDVSCGFRAYSGEALLKLNLVERFTYTQETILDLSHKELTIAEIPISVEYFADRVSRVAGSIFKYAVGTFLIILRFYRDHQPLRFFGIVGILIFLMGLGLDVWLIIHYFQIGTFSPYKVFGFLGGLLNLIGVLTIIMALIADMFDRIRTNQEQILYFQKRDYFRKLRIRENEK